MAIGLSSSSTMKKLGKEVERKQSNQKNKGQDVDH